MEAPHLEKPRESKRSARYARVVTILLGVVLAIGAWQTFGVLIHGIEGSYAH